MGAAVAKEWFEAAQRGDIKVCESLLDKHKGKLDVNLVDNESDSKETALG
jgi:hypothetical protein